MEPVEADAGGRAVSWEEDGVAPPTEQASIGIAAANAASTDQPNGVFIATSHATPAAQGTKWMIYKTVMHTMSNKDCPV